MGLYPGAIDAVAGRASRSSSISPDRSPREGQNMDLLPSAYVIDKGAILLKAYRLYSLFGASRRIAASALPSSTPRAAAHLEAMFLETEVASLLLEIAAMTRALDDQVRARAKRTKDEVQLADHEERLERTRPFTMELTGPRGAGGFKKDESRAKMVGLRDVCSKILHADAIRLPKQRALEPHPLDIHAVLGHRPPSVEWEYLSGEIDIIGTSGTEPWHGHMRVDDFIDTLWEVLSDKPSC